jgi:hypothetical protein
LKRNLSIGFPGWEIAEWFCVLDENKAYDDVVRKPAGVAPNK